MGDAFIMKEEEFLILSKFPILLFVQYFICSVFFSIELCCCSVCCYFTVIFLKRTFQHKLVERAIPFSLSS